MDDYDSAENCAVTDNKACRNKTLLFWVGGIQIQTEMAAHLFCYFSNAFYIMVLLFNTCSRLRHLILHYENPLQKYKLHVENYYDLKKQVQ